MVESNATFTDCEKKIIRQIEYYFGDVNLGRDKFLQEQIKLDDGWVPMETMLKFNRLKEITEDAQLIVDTLRKSTSGLMEVNEDSKRIRRSVDKPLPVFGRELAESMKQRSVYAKGFPKDLKLDEAMEFFEKYGPVDNIYMRRGLNREFKGSCFVTYAAKEGAEKFMTAEDAKFSSDIELIKYFKEDYFKSKNKDKKQSEEKKVEKEKVEKELLKEKMVQGAILCVTGLPEGIKREEIKSAFSKYGQVEWVDIKEQDKIAKLRFSQTDEAKAVIEKAKSENEDGKIILREVEVTCSTLEGDEELDHWAEIFKSKAAHQSIKKGGNKRGASFGHKRSNKSGGPKPKRTKKNNEDDGNNSD